MKISELYSAYAQPGPFFKQTNKKIICKANELFCHLKTSHWDLILKCEYKTMGSFYRLHFYSIFKPPSFFFQTTVQGVRWIQVEVRQSLCPSDTFSMGDCDSRKHRVSTVRGGSSLTSGKGRRSSLDDRKSGDEMVFRVT